jgi:hypothetical protein
MAGKTKIYITEIDYTHDIPVQGQLLEVGNGIYSRWAFNKKELVYETKGVRGGIYVARILE